MNVSGGQGPALLGRTAASRSAGVSFERWLSPEELIDGELVAYLLSSLWSDEPLTSGSIVEGKAEGEPARLQIETRNRCRGRDRSSHRAEARSPEPGIVDLPRDEVRFGKVAEKVTGDSIPRRCAGPGKDHGRLK